MASSRLSITSFAALFIGVMPREKPADLAGSDLDALFSALKSVTALACWVGRSNRATLVMPARRSRLLKLCMGGTTAAWDLGVLQLRARLVIVSRGFDRSMVEHWGNEAQAQDAKETE